MEIVKEKKPDVCICDFTVRYVPLKYMNRINSHNPLVKRKAIEEHVKEFYVSDWPITLNENNKFPTKTTELRCLKSVWLEKIKNNKFKDYSIFIKNIVVKKRSKVSYEFNYNKD